MYPSLLIGTKGVMLCLCGTLEEEGENEEEEEKKQYEYDGEANKRSDRVRE